MYSVLPAVLGFAGVVVGALLAALLASHRERIARREDAQRDALHLLQASCLAHRRALQHLAAVDVMDPGALGSARERTDLTLQDLDLVQARVLSDEVLERVATWRTGAKRALLGDDVAPVTASEEDDAWQAVHEAVKQELRRLSSPALRRRGRGRPGPRPVGRALP